MTAEHSRDVNALENVLVVLLHYSVMISTQKRIVRMMRIVA